MENHAKNEKVSLVSIALVDDFPEHPFMVKDDESMEQLIHSIEMNGILNPIIARKKEDGRYEVVSGHRRKHACSRLGIAHIPVIVRELSRDEAVIEMVDSNLQREYILPSEKARAYKMKMDAMKRQGKRTDLTSAPVVQKLPENTTRALIASENGESREQVRRYIRLNELTPELLEFVDEGKIGLRPAVEISYLQEEEQRDLVDFIDTEGTFPSHAQTIRMKELSREGKLDTDTINDINRSRGKNSVIVVFTDIVTPSIPVVFPNFRSEDVYSIGTVLSKPDFFADDVVSNMVMAKDRMNIGYLGYKDSENSHSFPEYNEGRAKYLYDILLGIADYVIVDCMSLPDANNLTKVALENADQKVILWTPDLKSMSFRMSQLKTFDSRGYMKERDFSVMNVSRQEFELAAADAVLHLGKIDVTVPYCAALTEQYMEGVLFETLKDKKFIQAIKAIAERTV